MKLDRLLFGAILVLCAVVALTALQPSAGAGGVAHSEHATMRHGGSGSGDVVWLGWAFGVAIFGVFAALIAFGARRHIRDIGKWLVLALAAVISAWTWVVFAYRDYLVDPAPELYLALPAPTAIMAYLFWPLTLVFVSFFVLGFRHWVLSEDDLETYQQLLGERKEDKP